MGESKQLSEVETLYTHTGTGWVGPKQTQNATSTSALDRRAHPTRANPLPLKSAYNSCLIRH